jgi:hypothetical protein
MRRRPFPETAAMSPFRRPCWRWLRAQALIATGKYLSKLRDDKPTRIAGEYLREIGKCRSDLRLRRVRARFRYLAEAHGIWQATPIGQRSRAGYLPGKTTWKSPWRWDCRQRRSRHFRTSFLTSGTVWAVSATFTTRSPAGVARRRAHRRGLPSERGRLLAPASPARRGGPCHFDQVLIRGISRLAVFPSLAVANGEQVDGLNLVQPTLDIMDYRFQLAKPLLLGPHCLDRGLRLGSTRAHLPGR